MKIRPVSDLRNKFTEIEKDVSNDVELKLSEADYQAEHTEKRLTHEDVFSKFKRFK